MKSPTISDDFQGFSYGPRVRALSFHTSRGVRFVGILVISALVLGVYDGAP